MSAALAVLLVVAAGVPVGYALLRDVRLAVLVAPMVTGMSATLAVILMLVLGGDLRWWLGGLLVVQWALTPVLLRRTAGTRAPFGRWADVLWLVVPLLPPMLLVFMPPVLWDANSIWWLHAAYFTKGAALAREYVGLPSMAFTHTDYPPFASATIAGAWSVIGGYKLYVAQFVSAALTFSAIAMLGYAVRVVTGRAPAVVSRLAGVGVALAAWGADPYGVAGGYVDALWAAAFTAAALLLLFRRDPLRRPLLAVLLLAAVALTKNEGFLMAVVLAAVATVRVRREWRRAWILWLPVAAGLVWNEVARHLGAKSDVTSHLDLHGLLRGDPAIYGRLPPTLSAIWTMVGTIVAVSAATAVLGGIFLRGRRRAFGLGADLWLWSLAAVYLAVLAFTYLISQYPIGWYLSTSINRVSLPFALVAAASAACWAAVALARGGGTPGGMSTAIRPQAGGLRERSQEIPGPAVPSVADGVAEAADRVAGDADTLTGVP